MNNNPRDPHYNGRSQGNIPPRGNGQYRNQPNPRTNGNAAGGQSRQTPQNGVQRPQYQQRPQNSGQHRSAVQGNRPNSQYPPVRHRSRKQARKAALTLFVTAFVILALLVSVIIFAARCAVNYAGKDVDTHNSGITEQNLPVTVVTEPPETEPPVTEPVLDPAYRYVTMTDADVHKGYQLLINYQYPYTFDGDYEMKTLFSAKNGCYKVTNISDSLDSRALTWFVSMMSAFSRDTGHNDVIVTSSDRTYEFQESLYNDRVDRFGEEYAQMYVAKPGHSEHHTGIALDLAIYTDGGRGMTFDDMPEYSEWLRANAHKFGFIERYTADKTAITKIAYESWHYRYIGKPHAYYMVTNLLCLEEYVELISQYSFNEQHLIFTDDDGVNWDIYYVAADPSGTTDVPVPKDHPYEVSGNNYDGFIVTVQK